MRHIVKMINLLPLMSAFLFLSSTANAFKYDKVPYYELNSVQWGQIAGCILRFDYYKVLSMENSTPTSMLPAEAIEAVVGQQLGNTSEAYLYMYDMGYNNGFLDDNVMSGEAWENMILEVAEQEFEQGTAWLQAMGCTKMLMDLEIL